MVKRGLLIGFAGLFFLLTILSVMGFVSAEKIQIEIKNTYMPGDNVVFKITLLDDYNKKIDGMIDYKLHDNIFNEIIPDGTISSGEERTFKLPENTIKGYGEVVASYNDIEAKELFNVGELEKADFKIEGDKLIITNIGNVAYTKSISISIGNHKETILVPLGFNGVKGDSKTIRLTAPSGNYEVRVNDGTQKEDNVISSSVSLTGNVIGVESLSGNSFFSQYPMVTMFLVALALVVIVIVGLKIYHRYF